MPLFLILENSGHSQDCWMASTSPGESCIWVFQWAACNAAGSGRLRHPEGPTEFPESRRCRRYLRTDLVASHDLCGSGDVERGQGHWGDAGTPRAAVRKTFAPGWH